jgi:hypothetical protein
MTRNRGGNAERMIRCPANIRHTCYPRLSNPKRIAEFRDPCVYQKGVRREGFIVVPTVRFRLLFHAPGARIGF